MQVDLAIVIGLALAAFLSALLSVSALIALPLVASLVLFLPGYVLLNAVIIGSSLSALERVLIAIAASISMTIAVGLLMAVLGIPIERVTWAFALTGASLAGAVVAWVRRLRNGVSAPTLSFARTEWRQMAVVVIAGLIVANVLAANRIIAVDQFGLPPAQLWMIDGTDPYNVNVGFRADSQGGDYRVTISAGGQPIHEFDVTVKPSETWQTNLALTQQERAQQVVARLYLGDDQIEQRDVVLQPLPSSSP